MNLAEQIEAKRTELALLERRAVTATCVELGHDWKFSGGSNCGCDGGGRCSVPVNECKRCGDCDYGDNHEADEVRRLCAAQWPD